ncbi:MAG: hypothetical protein AAF646_05335 [Pseudomonadota bacterium]
MTGSETTSQGVDALIAKLRDEGVAAGRAEAEQIVAEARAEAARIVERAESEAKAHMAAARKSADQYRSAGEEALNTAMRDAVLTMKAGLMAQFEADVQRMVSATLAEPEMLKQMILELVGSARDAGGVEAATEVILPAEVVGPDAIKQNPEDIQSGKLTKFVLGLSQDMLKAGVTLYAADDLQAGIRAQIHDRDLALDLSDEAIASLLMQHLQPRFRAVMEGVIR